jgi:hypothetical protein
LLDLFYSLYYLIEPSKTENTGSGLKLACFMVQNNC